MPKSPELEAESVLRVTLQCDGANLPPTVQVLSVQVRRAVNAIPWARVVVEDGDIATGEFEVADGKLLAPGAALSIALGYDDEEAVVFQGVVVRLGVQLGRDGRSQLVAEARDKAVAMTLGRRHRFFSDKKDSAAFGTLLSEHGLQADVKATDVEHGALVQHDCSDWDFLLARAEANGCVVVVGDGKVSVAPPDTSAEPALKVTWGFDLLSFDADIDARTQVASVDTSAWDPAALAALAGDAAPKDLGLQGDLKAAKLAEVLSSAVCALRTGANRPQAELKAWAQASQLKAALARVRGRMRFQGSALALPGTLLEVAGVGKRFNGKVYAGAVQHEVRDGDWITEVEIGLDPAWSVARADVLAPPAGALLPGVQGLQLGVVVKLDGDPDSAHRIQVRTPAAESDAPAVWARLLMPYASGGFGLLFAPEVGDEVLVGHVAGDPAHPVVLGSLYGGKHAPPTELIDGNPIKTLVTQSGHKLEFDDENKVVTLETPAGNQLVLSDQDKALSLTDQHGNKIVLDSGGITIDSTKELKLKAATKVSIEAGTEMSLQATTDLKAKGLNVQCTADVGFKAAGNATAELSASGQTTVKGAIVMIN